MKLKLADTEAELEELKRENEEIYKTMITTSKKEAAEFAKKFNKAPVTIINEQHKAENVVN